MSYNSLMSQIIVQFLTFLLLDFFFLNRVHRGNLYTGDHCKQDRSIITLKRIVRAQIRSITIDTWKKTFSRPMGHHQRHFLYSSKEEFLLSDASCEQKIPIFLSIWIFSSSKDFIYPGIFAGWDGKGTKDYSAWFKVYTPSREWTQSFFSWSVLWRIANEWS